jgi:pimeloyl-ACP methyl ester carboxylesterase
MTKRAFEQSWVTDTLLAGSGYEVLHPESRHFLGEIGYNPVDFSRVLSRVKAASMFPKAYSEVAVELERKAHYYEDNGFNRTAHDLYNRATLLYGRARHAFPTTDKRHAPLNRAVERCLAALIRTSDIRIERLTVPFDGLDVHVIAHYPNGDGPWPLVLLLPGMDMRKEDWTKVARNYYVSRGFAALAVDGPGQGATAMGGLRVTIDNYERAISAVLDQVLATDELDAERVGLWGVSMGSYWGLRTAAQDPRVKALATAMGCYGAMDIIFGRAQPAFKANYMRMSGYTDEEAFASEVASRMGVIHLAEDVRCPTLMSYGEFDELSTLEETIALYEKLGGPKHLMVYEQEFHALGGVGAEIIGAASDWLVNTLSDNGPRDAKSQSYVMRSGEITSSAQPEWWAVSDELGALEPQGVMR